MLRITEVVRTGLLVVTAAVISNVTAAQLWLADILGAVDPVIAIRQGPGLADPGQAKVVPGAQMVIFALMVVRVYIDLAAKGQRIATHVFT